MVRKSSIRYRFDERVTRTMILVGALSLFVLAFRVKGDRPCQPVKLTTQDSVYYQDASVLFRADARDAQTFEWDFHDGTPVQTTKKSTIIHPFRQEGNFFVSVVVNGKCEDTKKIRIVKAPLIVDTSLAPSFTGPDSAFVNDPVTFVDETPDATSWEWYFDDSGNIGSMERTATHYYGTPGLKTITLKVDGRSDRITSRQLYVEDDPRIEPKEEKKRPKPIKRRSSFQPRINLPDTPVTPPQTVAPPEVKKAPEISNERLGELLKKIAGGSMNAESFSVYLGGNLNIEVFYNKKKMTFSEMCKRIAELKKECKIKFIDVLQVRNETGHIVQLTVTLQKKWIIGSVVC